MLWCDQSLYNSLSWWNVHLLNEHIHYKWLYVIINNNNYIITITNQPSLNYQHWYNNIFRRVAKSLLILSEYYTKIIIHVTLKIRVCIIHCTCNMPVFPALCKYQCKQYNLFIILTCQKNCFIYRVTFCLTSSITL